MIGGMVALFLVFAIYGIVTFDLSIQEMKKLLSTRNEAVAFSMMQDLDQRLENRISGLKDFTKISEVQSALKDSNVQFSLIPDIENINLKDPEIEFEGYPLIPTFLEQAINQKLTIELKDTIDFYRDEYDIDVFQELFITNAYGVNVALGSGISVITLENEDWWQISKEQGIFYGELKYREAYNSTAIGLAYRIDDENGNFLGVLRALVSLDDLLADFIGEAELINNQNTNVVLKLFDNHGSLIYSNTQHGITDSNQVSYFQKIVNGDDAGILTLGAQSDDVRLVSYAKSTGYKSFEGFGWIITVEQDSSSVVDEFVDLRNSILIVSIIGMVISAVIGLIISKLVTKPLSDLSKMAKSIAKGNFSVRSKKSNIHELDIIGLSFTKMAQSLEQLIETEKKLAEANTRVKNERFTEIGELAASVAHNMKNPLGTIQTSADIIKRESKGKNEELDKVLSRMDRAIARISNQIEGVLNFVRTTPVNLTKVSINSILESAKESLEITENITLKIPDEPKDIICDSKKMEIVFINLIVNAIQAIGKEEGTITIRVKDEGDFNLIEFEDTGSGMPEKILLKIFDPLITTKEKGTGLGLSSCKNIIEQHGGTISAKNNPTTFTIKLPKNPKLG